MELWILASLIAASLQTVRFMLQKILSTTPNYRSSGTLGDTTTASVMTRGRSRS